jgi:hypothetical protein
MNEVITISADELEFERSQSRMIADQFRAMQAVVAEERQYAMTHGAPELAERLDSRRMNVRMAQLLASRN